jgi:hypothetical protein
MFATCLVAPSVVSKSSWAHSELVAEKMKQSRTDFVGGEHSSRKSHQADLHGEAQLIAMAAFRKDQIQIFATQRGEANQGSFVGWGR